jgi:SsrA-binding protein
MSREDEQKYITINRKAYRDYHIEQSFEAGLVLTGTEIKSLRAGRANLQDAYAVVENGEVFLMNAHISPYEHGNRYNPDPKRKRKLLLHMYEIRRLIGKTQEKGLTLVPLRMYFRRGYAKVELALARGKKLHDKRDAIAERQAHRDMERAFKEHNR